jgi:hypothetical protein
VAVPASISKVIETRVQPAVGNVPDLFTQFIIELQRAHKIPNLLLLGQAWRRAWWMIRASISHHVGTAGVERGQVSPMVSIESKQFARAGNGANEVRSADHVKAKFT